MIREITERECKDAIARGGFDPPEGARAALILTQSWCPQWRAMKAYLMEADAGGLEASIAYMEYDLAASFEECMKFKEHCYHNREIPYVRYFRDGICTGESNYVSLDGFLHRLGAR